MKTLIERWKEVKKTATPVVDEGGENTVGYDGEMWANFKASITPADMTALEGQLPEKYTSEYIYGADPLEGYRIVSTTSLDFPFLHYTVWDTDAYFIITITRDEETKFTGDFNYHGLNLWLRSIVSNYREYGLCADDISYEWDDEGNCTSTIITLRRGHPV